MDITRFHATFFEESREGLDAMESGLLALESGNANSETINTIFRAAHSIKGGAGTFGFTAVANFTHVLETLLDEMRGGRREVTADAVAVLIESVDVLRMLLESAEGGSPVDADMLSRGEASLNAMMGGDKAAPVAKAAPAKKAAPKQQGWQIGFKPMPSMYMTGNDPLRILRELERLGTLTAEFDGSRVPSFSDLDPFETHLAWNLTLAGGAARDAVDGAFSWVEDECELDIKAVAGAAEPEPEPEPEPVASPAPTPAADATPAAAAAIPQRRVGDAPVAAAEAAEASIRVGIGKVDALINLVGELVITQSMLKQTSSDLDPAHYEALLNGLTLLERNTRDLQEAVMSVRMLPMESVFSRFPRVVRDVASKIGKQVRLKTVGESTELDKGMIEKIVDPLTHLVRNAVDHGLETPDERKAAGKDPTGTVGLIAAHQGGQIVIEVTDDGRGLNRDRIVRKAIEHGIPGVHESMPDHEVWQLIFHPGLSTAEKITDLSGRGVGMDVVKKNIVSLGGSVDIASAAGRGSTVTIRLPLTLAILDGMSVAVGEETFILPLASVLESLQPKGEDIRTLSGTNRMVRVRGDYVPMLALHQVFGVDGATDDPHEGILVLIENDGRKLALLVDELVGQQQVVIKNLESNYRRVQGISGATILGDGRVALIVDVGGLSRGLSAAA
ncbi:MAG TPA: chemotaxis protein CheW [Arenimonas sp.]|nr:chemotaxis protein CheW [Arenimonas sp.]